MPGTSSPVSPGSSEIPMSFQFVNLTDPSDTKDQKVRRAIRSHVTKQQHQKAEQLAAARRSNSDPQLLGTSSAHILQGRAHAASYPLSRPTSSDQHSPVSPTSSSDLSSFPSTPQYPMIDVSQVYPAQWLPYLNQILENCEYNTKRLVWLQILTCTCKQILLSQLKRFCNQTMRLQWLF